MSTHKENKDMKTDPKVSPVYFSHVGHVLHIGHESRAP